MSEEQWMKHAACSGKYCPPHSWHTCQEVDALTERAERAEAQVRRVRDACDNAYPINDIPTKVVTQARLLHILDGDA